MALFDFIKSAGEKLFHHTDTESAASELAAAPDDAAVKERVEALNRKAGDQTHLHRVFTTGKDDRDSVGRLFRCQRRWRASCKQNRDRTLDQVGGQL